MSMPDNFSDCKTRILTLEAELAKWKGYTYCAYCGTAFDLDAGEQITTHIRTCQEHPMRQVEAALAEEKDRYFKNEERWKVYADQIEAALTNQIEMNQEKFDGRMTKLVKKLSKSNKKLFREQHETQGKLEEAEAELSACKERVREMEEKLFKYGEMKKAPCFVCGYNGQNYYSPSVHPCAERHHRLQALQAQEQSKEVEG